MKRVNFRHRALERRMRRTCYYADGRPLDRLSLPLTEAVVEYFAKNAPFDDLNMEYASQVSYAGAVSPSVLIVAMIYLERMRINNKDHFESSDPADLFTSALLCATKFLYDEAEGDFVYNDEWALSCSRTLSQINKSEVDFLNALNWDILAREEEFYEMLRKLESVIALKEWRKRGEASYTDLSILASNLAELWNEAVLPALVVIGMATLTYTATVFGLYTCSLYASTSHSPDTSAVSPINSPPPSPTPPAAHLLPSPPPILSVAFETVTTSNRVQARTKAEHTSKKTIAPAVVENASIEPSFLWKISPKNITRCEIGEMKSEPDIDLSMSPWAFWFLSTKAVLGSWVV